MQNVMIRVWLPIDDPEAVSAQSTIVDMMKLPLLGLTVSTLWQIHLSDTVENTDVYVNELIERVGIFVNPNRDRFEILPDFNTLDRKPTAPQGHVNWVLVQDGDGSRPNLAEKLRLRYGYESVLDVMQGRLWRLEVEAENEAAATQLVEQITTTKSRTQGLLSNPHAQTWVLAHGS